MCLSMHSFIGTALVGWITWNCLGCTHCNPTVSPALPHCLAHTEADGFAVARYLMVGFVAVTDPNVRETIVEEDSKESDDPDEPEWVDQTPQQAEKGDHSTLGRYWSLIQATN